MQTPLMRFDRFAFRTAASRYSQRYWQQDFKL
jgi:hypothetical protein